MTVAAAVALAVLFLAIGLALACTGKPEQEVEGRANYLRALERVCRGR